MKIIVFAFLSYGILIQTWAADELLIPSELNAVISKIHPSMSTHEVETALSPSYPKVTGHRGDWSGRSGYIDYTLNDRFTLSVSSVTQDGKDIPEVAKDGFVMLLFDWSTKRRVDIKIYDWDKQPPKVPSQK
jgi:hypothetical protein